MVDAMRRLGARAVCREGQRVLAWLPPPPDVDGLVREAEAALRLATSMGDPALAWRWESHEEWAERWGGGEPRRVTSRIVVAPLGRAVERRDGDIVVRFEVGPAFGTAEHPTTRGCLQLLEAVLRPRDRVVDIGTGSGILAIAAARLGAASVLALEADALSCASARRNVVANRVADRVEVRERTVGPADLRTLARLDVVLANLEAGVLDRLLPGLRRVLARSGSLVVAGVTGGEKPTLLRSAAAVGLEPHLVQDVDGWWCAALRRRR